MESSGISKASLDPSALESPLAAQHRAAGATLGTYFGVRLPSRFGEFNAEYRIARRGVALLDTNYRAVFSLTGPDRVRYLNAVLSSNIRDLKAGQSAIGLLLNAQGHIQAELETLALEDRFLIFGYRFNGARTAQLLDKFIIMDDATLSDESAGSGTLAVAGPAAPELARELTGVDLAALAPGDHVAASVAMGAGSAAIACRVICRAAGRGFYGWPGAEFLASAGDVPALWEALAAAVRSRGGGPIGYEALNALRLEAGIPWYGKDFDERVIPQEASLEATHLSFTKGCYPGQEIVERVRSRGQVNRRLTGLAFAGAEIPAPGARLLADGAEAGSVTSAARSPLLRGAVGLGYVRREFNQAGQILQCAASPDGAEVIELPLPGALPPTGK